MIKIIVDKEKVIKCITKDLPLVQMPIFYPVFYHLIIRLLYNNIVIQTIYLVHICCISTLSWVELELSAWQSRKKVFIFQICDQKQQWVL